MQYSDILLELIILVTDLEYSMTGESVGNHRALGKLVHIDWSL